MSKFANDKIVQADLPKAKLKRSSEGEISATLTFAVPMDGNLIRTFEQPIREAFHSMKRSNEIVSSDLDLDLENRSIELRNYPERKKAEVVVHAVEFKRIYLEKIDGKPNVFFDVTVPLDGETGPWLLRNFGASIWIQSYNTQPSLLPEAEEEKKASPPE